MYPTPIRDRTTPRASDERLGAPCADRWGVQQATCEDCCLDRHARWLNQPLVALASSRGGSNREAQCPPAFGDRVPSGLLFRSARRNALSALRPNVRPNVSEAAPTYFDEFSAFWSSGGHQDRKVRCRLLPGLLSELVRVTVALTCRLQGGCSGHLSYFGKVVEHVRRAR